MSELTKKVFRQISQRFTSRARDIARFAKTHYSFEEWCNWEAFVACSGVSGWKVRQNLVTLIWDFANAEFR